MSIQYRQKRPFKRKQQQEESVSKTNEIVIHDNLMIASLFIISLPVRFRNLKLPNQVIFNEVYFGQAASNYIQRSFFFDVHPPLVKLLLALVAWISGYDGTFDFSEAGSEYTKNVPYVQMRYMSALFGSLVIPLAYLTMRNMGLSRIASFIPAIAICLENGLVANNRLIMLDSYMLFFIAFTTFAYTKTFHQRPLSNSWYKWLFLTGVGLGCSVSTKWVGLFTIITIAIPTLKNLWHTLGDLNITKRQYALNVFAKLVCFVIVPAIIYLGSFYIHFALLVNSGSGDHYMSIETQYELKGDQPIDTPSPVTYGSLITIRHLQTAGGYLHSHFANYPEGSNQQQVTLYPFRDQNNWWKITKAIHEDNNHTYSDILSKDRVTWLEYIRDGDIVVLEHVNTSPRKLHSHDVPAPVTETDYHFEVSGYGFPNHEGDSNDMWRVIIEKGDRLESRQTRFRLLHLNQNCHLYSTTEKLPDWGYEQQEVSCISQGLKPKTIWMVDETRNEMLPSDVKMVPENRPGFFGKFAKINRAMWIFNKELVEKHPYQSRPISWPMLGSFIPFWLSLDTEIIFFGNPIVYWASGISVLTFIAVYVFFQLREKRGFKDSFHGSRAFYENNAGFLVLGWAVHYLPFFLMKRQMFLHHYLPSLYFAILTFGVGIDIIQKKCPQIIEVSCLVAIVTCIYYAYCIYSPITYGEPWTVQACKDATLSNSWEFYCNRFAPSNSYERIQLAEEEEALVESQMDAAYQDVPQGTMENDDEEQMAQAKSDEGEEGGENGEDGESEGDNSEEYDGEDMDMPTDAPGVQETAPEFIDGKEVLGDEDDEDDHPSTIYGVDPEAEDDRSPPVIRDIPVTKADD